MSRSCFVLALVTLIASARLARATCIEERIDGLPYTCCTADDGETTCTLRPPPPPRPPDLTCSISNDKGDDVECCEPVDHSSKPVCGRPGWRHMRCEGPSDPRCFAWAGPGAWDHARQGHWNLELVPGLFAGAGPAAQAHAPFAGIDVKVRMLHRWEPSGSTIDRMLSIIPFMFVGNDFGLEVRAGTFATRVDGGRRSGAYAAIHPAALISAHRWRFVAALNFIPEVGVLKVEGRPAALHYAMRLPLGVILTRRLGLEAELGIGPEFGYSGGISMIVR